jgi:hypothetical protein
VLIEHRHYFRPFGGRKILYIWEAIEQDMLEQASIGPMIGIPMARGEICHG